MSPLYRSHRYELIWGRNELIRSFVSDGNFTADHIKQKRREDDVWLTAGEGVMTERTAYAAHLAVAKETTEVSADTPAAGGIVLTGYQQKDSCDSGFRAIEAAHMSGSKQNDVNGIVAHACARHGCFCPSSMVDLPLGERQASVDYSKSKAFETTNVKKIRKIMDIYDIMCQYFKKIGLRFELSDFLNMPDFKVEKAIGQFHVHGHKDVCYFRFSTAFIPGAGQVDGEVMETLWAILNRISWGARTTTLAHRAEILDDHANDSNWKKLTNIGGCFIL